MLIYVSRALQQMAFNANYMIDAATILGENTGTESTEAAQETDDLARATVVPGATGREYLEQMERQLQADNPARAQASRNLGANLAASTQVLQDMQTESDRLKAIPARSAKQEQDLQIMETRSIPRMIEQVTRLRQGTVALEASPTELQEARDRSEREQTVDGIVSGLRTRQLANQEMTPQMLRVLDHIEELRRQFGRAKINTRAGQSAIDVLDAAISEHGRRHKNYKLSDKELRKRNSSVGLNWHSRVQDAQKAKAVYLSGQAQAYGKLFKTR